MADGRGQGVHREVPSAALDRLFLELHDKLPRDARGKLAQLADEMKRLTEPSTAKAPVTPPSSADQTVVRREEKIATTEAKQSPVSYKRKVRLGYTSVTVNPVLPIFCIPVRNSPGNVVSPYIKLISAESQGKMHSVMSQIVTKLLETSSEARLRRASLLRRSGDCDSTTEP